MSISKDCHFLIRRIEGCTKELWQHTFFLLKLLNCMQFIICKYAFEFFFTWVWSNSVQAILLNLTLKKVISPLFAFFNLETKIISFMTLYKPLGRLSHPRGSYNVIRKINSSIQLKYFWAAFITYIFPLIIQTLKRTFLANFAQVRHIEGSFFFENLSISKEKFGSFLAILEAYSAPKPHFQYAFKKIRQI